MKFLSLSVPLLFFAACKSSVPSNICSTEINSTSNIDYQKIADRITDNTAKKNRKHNGFTSYWNRRWHNEPSRQALKQLIWSDPHPDAKGADHNWNSPTFEPLIKKHLAQFINDQDNSTL
jgi:hypothetical protein